MCGRQQMLSVSQSDRIGEFDLHCFAVSDKVKGLATYLKRSDQVQYHLLTFANQGFRFTLAVLFITNSYRLAHAAVELAAAVVPFP